MKRARRRLRGRAVRRAAAAARLSLAALLPLVLLLACQPPKPVAHAIRYQLGWRRERAVADAARLIVFNDLGYRVELSRGYVTTRSIELIACDPAAITPLARALDAASWLLSPRLAYAGHTGVPDPSSTKSSHIESLLNVAQPSLTPLIHPGAQTYCRAHYLAARADQNARGLPADVDMVDQTLYLEGRYRAPQTGVEQPFVVKTALANGTLADLQDAAAHISQLHTATQSATIIVSRDLDHLFDHIDFASMDNKRVGRTVLENLIAGVRIELKLESEL